MAWLTTQDVADVVLNLHHRPASLTAIVGDGRHLGVRARYSWEQPLLGSAGGPRHALPLIDSEPFLIVNGDTLCDMDLGPMLDEHAASGADVTMAVVPNPDPDHYNGIAADAERRVIGFVPRGRSSGTWHYVGVQVARASVFAALPDGVGAETVAGIYPAMAAAKPGSIRVWPTDATFVDVGTPRDYLAAALTRGTAATRGVPGARTASAGVTHSVIWPGARIAPGALLDGCIVAGDVEVPAGFRARSSIIVPASILRPGDRADVRADLAVFPVGR
jgi:NDP-sugar pyrophosphorylase family protein